MKTLNKTFGLSLIFSTFMLIGFTPDAQADCATKDCTTSKKRVDTTITSSLTNGGEFDYDFSEPFFFTDKIGIHIYGQEDNLLYSGTFTKEEIKSNAELKGWLKKSEFLLSIDNQHYYFSRK